MFLRLVKSALFAAAAAMIGLVAFLSEVLQYEHSYTGTTADILEHPHRPPGLQSLSKLFWTIGGAVAHWLAEEDY